MGTYIHQIHYITSDDSKMWQTLSHTEAATLSLQTKRTRVNSVSSGPSFAILLDTENSTGACRRRQFHSAARKPQEAREMRKHHQVSSETLE